MMQYTFLLCLCTTQFLCGWWDLGHMAIAQVAYAHLSPEVRQQVEETAGYLAGDFPESGDVITAACWAGDVREGQFSLFQVYTAADPVHALEQCYNTLVNPSASEWAKAVSLRLLLQLVGDLHQPFHDSKTEVFVQEPRPLNTVRHQWESAFGLALCRPRRPLTPEGRGTVYQLSRQIVESLAVETVWGEGVDFAEWRAQSAQIRKVPLFADVAPGMPLSAEYKAKGKEVCLQQMARAAYRLAYLLETIYDGDQVLGFCGDGSLPI